MTISFDNIPATLRTPGTHIEFNNELAGATSTMFKVAIVGQRLATGTQAANIPVRVTDPGKAVTLFGRGSMLALQCAAFLKANTDTEMWAIALDDDVAANAAAGSITVNTAAVGAGTIALYIGGTRVAVGVSMGDDVSTIASSVGAAINANLDLPVTATVAAGVVTVTARNEGEVMNGFDLRASFYGEIMPKGVTLTFANLSGGSGNPDMTTALDAMGDDWFNWMACPYTDTANLVALETELSSRYGPMRQIGCRAFIAFAGTHSESGTFGSGRNSPHISCMAINTSPTPAYIVSAINAAVASKSIAIDPARPLQTLELTGMKAPVRHERWEQSERNLLLYDGM